MPFSSVRRRTLYCIYIYESICIYITYAKLCHVRASVCACVCACTNNNNNVRRRYIIQSTKDRLSECATDGSGAVYITFFCLGQRTFLLKINIAFFHSFWSFIYPLALHSSPSPSAPSLMYTHIRIPVLFPFSSIAATVTTHYRRILLAPLYLSPRVL